MVSNAIIYINNESRLIDIIKSDMKQTLEEAAKQELISSYAVVGDRGGFTELLYEIEMNIYRYKKRGAVNTSCVAGRGIEPTNGLHCILVTLSLFHANFPSVPPQQPLPP